MPSILVAHYTVAGAEGESGQMFLAGQDVVILPQTIDATGVTLGCFGHIHKPQRLGSKTPAFYCGSPNQLTFNDEGIQHGFYYHTIGCGAGFPPNGTVTESRFVRTPERRHFTLNLNREQIAQVITERKTTVDAKVIDAIVRVKYDADAEQDKQLDKKALEEMLKRSGAFHVADILRNDTEDEAALNQAAAEDTPAEILHRYLEAQRDGGTEWTDADIERMEEMALPIIRKAYDGRDASQHVGAFIPKRIEVTNYRSYTHEEFSFENIRMAMVNGPNGVGKSSLFMDAIADCLYESSRDGALGGWLRVGEKKGAITFEFEMGGYDYRVARTRNASGKGTLALARKNRETGEWENESDTTMRLTQERITKTIGLDVQTFCSIALIRQDAYGLFLDADSDRRMEILSSLLNLGIYVRAEELAKDGATEQRRAIAQLTDRMAVLNEQIAAKDGVEAEIADCEKAMTVNAAQKDALSAQIQAAEREETLRQEMTRQADEKAQEAARLDAQAAEKEAELRKQTAERDEAATIAALAESAAKAADTIKAARAELEPLQKDEAELKGVREQAHKRTLDLVEAEQEIARLQIARKEQEATLANRDAIEAASREMEAVRRERDSLPLAEYDGRTERIAKLKQEQAELVAESRVRIGEINSKIKAARKKTELLTASGCPIAATATCAFLKDAQEAQAELADLQARLDAMKANDRKAYERMTRELAEETEGREALGNPRAALAELAERERRAAPLAAQAGKLEAAAATIAQIDAQIASREKALGEMRTQMKASSKRIEELTASAERAEALRQTIRTAEPTAAMQTRCAAAEATVKALSVTIDLITRDAEKTRQSAAVTRQSADEMRARIPASTANLAALRANRDALTQEAQEAAMRLGGLRGKLERIRDAQTQWEAYRTEKGAAARTLNDYQTLAAAFGLDGIQYAIIRSTVPEIQSRANAILAAMTGGRMAVDFRTEREQKNKKIVNSLDVWITSLTGGSRPYSSHSGGEKVKIALAVTLGLADVKAHRAGVQLGMLWIDEPPFLDGEGTEAYADALASMANRNPEMRILAISHDPQLKARFPQNITVEAGENGSHVSVT